VEVDLFIKMSICGAWYDPSVEGTLLKCVAEATQSHFPADRPWFLGGRNLCTILWTQGQLVFVCSGVVGCRVSPHIALLPPMPSFMISRCTPQNTSSVLLSTKDALGCSTCVQWAHTKKRCSTQSSKEASSWVSDPPHLVAVPSPACANAAQL
jgi:hypothetical protein